MSKSGIPPRRAALYLTEQIVHQNRLMAELVAAGALERLQPEDRARAQRLSLECLRVLSRVDALLAKMMDKPPVGQVQTILRLGAAELCAGGAAHGVVNDWVQITGQGKRTQRMKGLVNAVLRRVSREGPELWETLPPPKMPDWLRAPLVEAWRAKAVEGMEAVQAAPPPLDLTEQRPTDDLDGERLETGSLRLSDAGQVSKLPGYDAGNWWVQDAAAAMPARLLDAQAGEKVLDLCAAPGGKTLQLAATGADVTAVDNSEGRLERLRENLRRTRLKAKVRVADVLSLDEKADAVLLDAPCSATGTLRRHPDLPYAKDGSGFWELFDLQRRMIDHAVTLLKPGGRLVFCTCSLLPDEGEVQAEEAMARHPSLTAERVALPAEWETSEGGYRLRPDYWADKGGMDGFYMIRWRLT